MPCFVGWLACFTFLGRQSTWFTPSTSPWSIRLPYWIIHKVEIAAHSTVCSCLSTCWATSQLDPLLFSSKRGRLRVIFLPSFNSISRLLLLGSSSVLHQTSQTYCVLGPWSFQQQTVTFYRELSCLKRLPSDRTIGVTTALDDSDKFHNNQRWSGPLRTLPIVSSILEKLDYVCNRWAWFYFTKMEGR